MSGDEFESVNLDRVEAIGKALSVAMRVRLLLAIARSGPASATMLAVQGHDAGNGISNTSYHLVKLEEAGLIEHVSSRRGRGSTERHFGLTAQGKETAAFIERVLR